MKAIDELREYASECCPEYEPYDSRMMRIADEIEAEVAECYLSLPADRNGETIRIGDEVWLHDEPDADPHIVRGYGMTNGCDVDVFINHADEGWCPNTVTVPDVLVRRKPDPLRELLHDACMNATRIRCVQGVGTDISIEVDETELASYAERIRDLMGGAR